MAYKFQKGAAILSGSAKFEDGLVATDVDDTTAGNIVAEIDNGEIASTKVALADGNVLIGDSNGHATARTFSGDIGVNNAGLVTIQANAVEGSMINSNAAGNGLGYSANSLNVDAAQTVITSILNNSFTTIGRAGGADDLIDFSSAGSVVVKTNDVARLTVADASTTVGNNLIVSGDLTVNGTTTSVNSTTIEITSSFTFEGASPDAHETVFGVTDPVADATINLPAMAAGTYHVPVLAAVSTTAITATPAEINLIDGGTARGTTAVASGDGFLHNDGGTMRMTSVDKIADLFAGDGLAASSGVLAVAVSGAINLANDKIGLSGSFCGNGISFTGDHSHITSISIDANPDSFSVGAGGLTLANGVAGNGLAISTGVLSLDIDEMSELSAAPHATQDFFAVSDNGTEKKVTMTNVANGSFALVSGDVLIASGGAATIQADSVESTMLNDNCISGFDDIGAAIASTDELLISDAGTLKRTDMSRIKSFIGSGVADINAIGDANATLAVGVNAPSAAASAPRTWTLPASAGMTVGEVVIIKAYGNSATHPITIAQAGSQEIDGSVHNIVLESDNAAVSLYYVAADTWIIV